MKNPPVTSQEKSRKIIAGLPAFNEEKYIGTIVLKTKKHVDEVIIVDDGSTDQTAEVARLAGAYVIQHGINRGYGASIKSLLAEAKKREASAFVLLDADFQHNPDEIPDLLKPLSEGFDIVIGSRELQKKNVPRYRRFGQGVISRFSKVLSGAQVTDSESGFRVFSHKALNSLSLKENGMAISAETIARAAAMGLKITERPISIRYTGDGSTLNPIVHGLGVLNRIIIMISEKRPLLFFGISGSIFILAGVIAGCRALGIVFQGGGAVTGWSILSTILLVVGAFSVLSGVILDVLARRKR